MTRSQLFRGGKRVSEEATEYWMSFSDLMAGLLMVFALLLLAALFHYQSGVEGVREVLRIRQDVVEQLFREMALAEGRLVEIDEDGTVRFRENVLFSQGSAEVSPQGREQLKAFADLYLSILLGNERFKNQLKAIVIEGHTNDDGSYALNLGLSQDRAFSVMLVLLQEAGDYEEELKNLVTANGRSFSNLILKEDGTVDKVASRRIEVRFQLNDKELVQQVLDKVYRADD